MEEVNEALPKVQLRNKNKAKEEPAAKPVAKPPAKPAEDSTNSKAQSALERAMGTLYESTPEMEDNNEGLFY